MGGGYHAWYSSDTRTLDPIDYLPKWPVGLPNPMNQTITYEKTAENRKKYPLMTPPGPQLFLAPFGDATLLYGYDDNLNPVVVNSSENPSDMAMNVRKIKGYGSGPLSIEKVVSGTQAGKGERIFFTPLRAGKGWQPTRINNFESYIKAFGGLNRLGKNTLEYSTNSDPYAPSPEWVGAAADPDGRKGSKSNLSGNPFVPPAKTADDVAAHVWDDFIFPIGMEGLAQGLMAGARVLADMATGGAAEAVLAATSPLMDAAASELAGLATDAIQKASGIGKTQPAIDNFFTSAVDVPGVNDRSPDPNFVKDIRAEVANKDWLSAQKQMGDMMKSYQTPDPALTPEQNAARAKAFAEVWKTAFQHLPELMRDETIADPNRDRNNDTALMERSKETMQRMQYLTKSIPAAVQAITVRDKVNSLRFTDMSVDNRQQHMFTVRHGIVPPVSLHGAALQRRLGEVVQASADMHNNFYENVLAQKQQFEADTKTKYGEIIDRSLSLDEAHKSRLLTEADKQKFELMKAQGTVTDADFGKFVRDKAIQFYKQTGQAFDPTGELKADTKRRKDYSKMYKSDRDTFGALYEDSLAESEVSRLKDIFSVPTLDNWRIKAHEFAHEPEKITIPKGFDDAQRQAAEHYISTLTQFTVKADVVSI